MTLVRYCPSLLFDFRMENENHTGITALEWDPRGLSSPHGNQLAFADKSGYVGVFEGVYPPEEELTNRNADPLAEDSLLMEVRYALNLHSIQVVFLNFLCL